MFKWWYFSTTLCMIYVSGISAGPINLSDTEWNDSLASDISHLGPAIYGTPNEESGKILESWNGTTSVNPEELGQYIEGDILFQSKARNGLTSDTFKWHDGIVPYELSVFFSISDIAVINKAIEIYHKYTCIRFRKRLPSDMDYLSIINTPTGCWSSVGKQQGKQELNLQSPYCTTKVGTGMHELMHALGFLHEQNRWERDDFVNIIWDNILKGHENNFNKANKGETNGYGVEYDYRSVMHYSENAFSANREPTIVPKDPADRNKMGQRDGFSKGDILKLNAMYGCPGYLDKNNNVDVDNVENRPGLWSFFQLV